MSTLPQNPSNPFRPHIATILGVQDLTPDVKLLRVGMKEAEARRDFAYRPGQFAFVSAFGVGEAPFSITSLYSPGGEMEFAIRRVGTVSAALHEAEPGEEVGVRGPYGNSFPLEEYRGKNLLIIGGGIGLAPLRPVISRAIQERGQYGAVTLIYGARTPLDLVFAAELEAWTHAQDMRVELTVDRGDKGWGGRVALVPAVVKELHPSPQESVAIICGPPIMIRFVLAELKALGFANSQIVTTLEAKMKCGLGKCARCNIGDKYVCQDGPVFTFEQISSFLEQL